MDTRENHDSVKPVLLAAALLVLLGLAAWSNSFHGAFLFDDDSIVEDAGIRRLWPVWEVLRGPRPVVQLSLALNYSLGEFDVVGYHVFNLIVHLLAALTLFGVVRRTLLSDTLRERFGAHATVLAWAISAIWTVHPLQTESVTYIIQRAEAMMGLFYLLTMYCAIRMQNADCPRTFWCLAAIICCLLGMGCKPVMVTAPIMVLAYERLFAARSFREVFLRSWPLYAGLVLGWAELAFLVLSGEPSPEAGFGMEYVTPLQYALTQPGVIVHYLELSFWPASLCLDYRWPMATAAGQVILPAVFIAVLVAGTFLALWRAPAIGFLGLWFFLILAPTSSIMPIADACFEHRMYLSLAAVAALATLGTYRIAGLAFASWTPPQRRGGWAFLALAACAAILALGIRTFERNEDYRTALAIWSDVVAQRPNNARAQLNLGEELTGAGRYADAERYLSEAMRLAPRDAQVRYALGNLMLRQGRVAEAMKFYRDALERRPAYAQVHNNFGMLLLDQGHPEDALKHLQAAVQAKPQRAQLWNNLGVVLRRMGRIDEAIAALQEAVRLDSAYAKAHARLAELLALRGRNDEAAAHYREALRLMPDYPLARQGLDNLPRSGEGTRHD